MSADELCGHWDKVRQGLFQALNLLTDTQLGFVPRADTWSQGVVARHIANAEEDLKRKKEQELTRQIGGHLK